MQTNPKTGISTKIRTKPYTPSVITYIPKGKPMKNLVRTIAFHFFLLSLAIACTKEIDLKTEVEFTVTEQHKAEGYIAEELPTTVTVIPEEILEEFSYTYSYAVSKGEGQFMDNTGDRLPQNENIPLNPFSASMMYVGAEPGEHIVKVTATDNYGFAEEIEIEYSLTEVPPVIWTATSPIQRLELGNSVSITVTFERSEASQDVNYERNYRIIAGSGSLMEPSDQSVVELDEFVSLQPGIYPLNFVPDALGIMQLSFDLKGDDGETYSAEVEFEVLEEIVDTVIPEISLLGDNPLIVQIGSNYNDPGATALDDVDGDISQDIMVDVSQVDTAATGTYQVNYNVSDSSGNAAIEVIRTVEVVEGDNPQSGENDILAFAIPGQEASAVIDKIKHTVVVGVPSGTGLNVAPIVLSVSPGASVSPSQDEEQDFTNPVTYVVTAENGNEQEWTVTVNVAASTDKSIESFTIDGIGGLISGTDISVRLPAGSDATSLAPTVAFTGDSLNPQSGVTVDFTDPVTYTVTAEDGSTRDYLVTVTVEKSSEKDITQFVIEGVSGTFSGTEISLTLPSGNDEKSLSPSIDHTGESVSPASGTQLDFANPVAFTVTAEDNTQKTYTVSVTIENDRPTANASANPMVAAIDQDVNFTGSLSTDDIAISSYFWDFGDGNTSTSPDPIHSYNIHGMKMVTLTVTDDGGLTDTVTIEVDVPNLAPNAVAIANATEVDTGETVNFVGSASSDDADNLTYAWDFGDGITSILADPNHSYAIQGTYPVTLTVTDDGGLTDIANLTIIVTIPNRPPTAVASSDITSGPNILTVNFDGSGSSDPDGDNLTYSWVFGDGSSSVQMNPSHDFDVAGTYDVQLTVSDGEYTATDNITINVWAFNRKTGRYSAPPGSDIQVRVTSIGNGKGNVTVDVHAGSNRSGAPYAQVGTSWNGSDTDPSSLLGEDDDIFTMPPNGVVYFYGRHVETFGDSQTYLDISNNDSSFYNENTYIRESEGVQE